MDPAKHGISSRFGEHLPVVMTDNSVHTRTLYAPFISPPTPSPSPGPFESSFPPSSPPLSPDHEESDFGQLSLREFASLAAHGPAARRRYLSLLLGACSPSELLYISTAIAPMLTRDFLRELPAELALHTLSFVDDHRTLLAAASVSKAWRKLCDEEVLWRGLVHDYGYSNEVEDARLRGMLLGRPKLPYRLAFQYSQTSEQNRAGGGSLIGAYRAPLLAPEESGVVTSLALGAHTVVVGLANSSIQTFDVRTGKRTKSLKGHTSGVWAVCLVEPGGDWAGGPEGDEDHDDWVLHSQSYADDMEDCVPSSPDSFEPGQLGEERRDIHSHPPPVLQMPPTPPRKPRQSPWYSSYELGTLDDPVEIEDKPSDMAFASDGWGQSNTIVVSGGCDKDVRVWELPSGRCIYKLRGHTSTIRCLRVLHSRPIAVTGSRDHTLRVWDIRRGRQVRVLTGHEDSVRALDVFGNRVASGSYDRTCRLWDVDTGECLHVLRGHYHQIYVVVFDGIRIASAGLDTTVRVWDAKTGNCLALLQGHTALVCQLQIDTSTSQLVTGGSDGRVITFSLQPNANFEAVHKIPAHDSSVTSLQIEGTRLVTAGADGRVRVFDKRTGALVRELGSQSDSVWKVVAKGNGLAVCCRRNNRTVTEIWGFKPEEEEMQGLHQLFR